MSGSGVPLASLAAWHPAEGSALTPCLERGAVRAVAPDGAQAVVLAEGAGIDALLWAQQAGPALPEQWVPREDFEAWLRGCSERAGALAAASHLARQAGTADASAPAPQALSLRELDLVASPVVRLVNAMLYDALRAGASDVHAESTRGGLAVKYRIDGVLRTMAEVPGVGRAEQALSRIKVMAELDIAERRIPQDGRLQVVFEERPVDVRVSIMPSIHGEDAVLRILDRQHLARRMEALTLEALGFEAGLIARLDALARRPHGMVLVTGPTGSGKTTTLYAAIQRSATGREKVITIEDPVEYQLAGALQIPVNERKGLGFAKGLRSILRHDPDKILVGEIRDAETAQIAVQAALTGHLVFTTVHANDVFDVVARFRQFGIDGYALGSALNGVLAQRLLRKVCAGCGGRGTEGISSGSRACEACGGTGYRGRFAVGELLELGPRLKSLLGQGAPYEQVRQAVAEQGALGLRVRALAAAAAGLTTMEEADRVTAEG